MNYYDQLEKILKKFVGNNYDEELYDHTIRVAKNTSKICDSLLLKETDKKLMYLIAILHEIGKFKNKDTINLLFEEKMIRNFIQEATYDDIISSIIYSYTSEKNIDHFTDDLKKLYHILADSDRLDQLYMDSKHLEIGSIKEVKISSKMIKDFSSFNFCNKYDIKTTLDSIIYKMSYVFSFENKYSCYVVEQEKYIEKIISNLNIEEQAVINLFNELNKIVTKYILLKIGETYHGW